MTEPEPRLGLGRICAHMLSADADEQASIRISIASNESAFGPSRHAVDAIMEAASSAERYAENAASELARSIARKYSLDEKRIVVGPGSDDLLARIARAYLRAGDELICSRHGYQKIPNYAFANDARPVMADDREFKADVGCILDCVTDRTRIVMLANPDNPTGTWLSGVQVRELRDQLRSDILLVLDSAYLEYVDSNDFENPAELIESSRNVVMTRTFSKIYGLAGLRLGWLYGPHRVSESVRRIGLTFPISIVAFAAAMAALEDTEHVRRVFEGNLSVRAEFVSRLNAMGLHAYPSQTNFVLVRFPGGTGAVAYRHLLSQGVFARRLASQAFADCIRFTIGLEEEMRQVADILNHWVFDIDKAEHDERGHALGR